MNHKGHHQTPIQRTSIGIGTTFSKENSYEIDMRDHDYYNNLLYPASEPHYIKDYSSYHNKLCIKLDHC